MQDCLYVCILNSPVTSSAIDPFAVLGACTKAAPPGSSPTWQQPRNRHIHRGAGDGAVQASTQRACHFQKLVRSHCIQVRAVMTVGSAVYRDGSSFVLSRVV